MADQAPRYTIVYQLGPGVTVVRTDDENLGRSVRLTMKSFPTVVAAQRWMGNQGSSPWLVSDDGRAVTVLTRTGAHIFYFEDDEMRSLAMPIAAFMSMIDSSIHLFSKYHYGDDDRDDGGEWIPPTEWE